MHREFPSVRQTLFNCYPNHKHKPWVAGVTTERGGKDEVNRYGGNQGNEHSKS